MTFNEELNDTDNSATEARWKGKRSGLLHTGWLGWFLLDSIGETFLEDSPDCFLL